MQVLFLKVLIRTDRNETGTNVEMPEHLFRFRDVLDHFYKHSIVKAHGQSSYLNVLLKAIEPTSFTSLPGALFRNKELRQLMNQQTIPKQ